MWEEIASSVVANLQPAMLLTLALGTAVGTFIGALPGLSSISAIALVLPFTFGMDPAQGLVLLAAVYMSAEFGGSIPAILIGTPGTSGASVTMLDGYPMTRQGLAQEALYLQLFAGTVGGAMGALVLLFFTPTLARWSLLLGPPEIFWLTVAGLALVATLIGRNVLGGLIGVVLGVAFTTPGQDQMTGQLRFTFNNPDLVGGIPLVPALLGLFAVASVLTLLEQKEERVAPLHSRPRVIRFVLRRMMGMKKSLAWTSFVGTAVGVIPGLGSSASAFAAYAEAKRISDHPEQFGKGAWEGVMAPEAANNAVIGGSLVTLLGIGIPGSAPAAIMYGALTVHGILAGPRLFIQRADIAYTFMTGLLFTVVAMLLFGLLTIRYSALFVRAPVRFVIPGVLALTIIGTFGLRNNPFDVVVVVIAGVIGFLLEKVGVRWVAVALGLVLGQIMEAAFQQSLLIAPTRGGNLWVYWTTRPLTVALMLLVGLMLISGIRQMIRAGSEPVEVADEDAAVVESIEREEEAGAADTDEDQPRWMSLRTANLIQAVLLLGASTWMLLAMRGWRPRATYLPMLLAVLLIILAIALLVVNLYPTTAEKRAQVYPFTGVPWTRWWPFVIGLGLVAFTVTRIGFYETLFVYLFLGLIVATRVRPPAWRMLLESAVFAVIFTTVLYLSFDVLLNVPTPDGIFL